MLDNNGFVVLSENQGEVSGVHGTFRYHNLSRWRRSQPAATLSKTNTFEIRIPLD